MSAFVTHRTRAHRFFNVHVDDHGLSFALDYGGDNRMYVVGR